MNYLAYGEYIAYSRQSSDAAARRFALLINISSMLQIYAENPALDIDTKIVQRHINNMFIADREMRAAYERANQSAALCGEHKITWTELSPPAKPIQSGCQVPLTTVQK